MIIRINQKNCIHLANVSYTAIEFMKPKGGGGPDIPVHTVYMIGGKNFVVAYQDAIQILFPENNSHYQLQNIQSKLQAQLQQQTTGDAPVYAEEVNAPEQYVVLKSFNAANDPSIIVKEKTILKKTKVNGLTKWADENNAKIIFDYNALQNREYFAIPGEEPSTSVNEIPTPKIEKKP